MEPKTREIVRIVSGNVVGIITEPVPVKPAVPLDQQRIVKIGILDEQRGRREPFPAADVQVVTEKLLKLCTAL